jgi:hypothetical protein
VLPAAREKRSDPMAACWEVAETLAIPPYIL